MSRLVQTSHFQPQINLPVSKSILNRQLVLAKLCGQKLPDYDPAWPDDVRLLYHGLAAKETVDLDLAGTAVRFLMAYHALTTATEVVITGSPRMQERPLMPLIQALRELGASITCIKKEGHLPVRISGSAMRGGTVSIDVSQSSQFASALMLIGPFLPGGLELRWSHAASASYLGLTAQVMRSLGLLVKLKEGGAVVPPAERTTPSPAPEADWSAAAFLYSWFALSNQNHFLLPGLSLDSAQGDVAVARWFEGFGVFSQSTEEGVVLTKKEPWSMPGHLHFGASSTPDLVQATALCAAGLGVPATFAGIGSLVHKETNRIEALKETLLAAGLEVETGEAILSFSGKWNPTDHIFRTYGDHRMAMALAPLAQIGPLYLDDPKVVSKSFPDFWKVMQSLGLNLTT